MRFLILTLLIACGTDDKKEMAPAIATTAEEETEEKKAEPTVVIMTPLAEVECVSKFMSDTSFSTYCTDGYQKVLTEKDDLWYVVYEVTTQLVTIDGLTGYCTQSTTGIRQQAPMELQGEMPVENTDYTQIETSTYDAQCQLIETVDGTQVGVATYEE